MYLVLIVLVGIAIILRLPVVKGFLGEADVRQRLRKLPEEYITFHDVLVPNEGKTTQIDHIVVSPYGIFVIETKNYKGWIFGNEKSRYWTQSNFKRKDKFYNPIHQNYGHIKALELILEGIYEGPYFSIICFGNRATLKKIEVQSSNVKVIYSSQLLKTVPFNRQISFPKTKVQEIANKIKNSSYTDKKQAKKDHVKSIKQTQNEIKKIVDNYQCPKCGGQLVKRKGKYGEFLGCSNYPRCRFIQKKANKYY